MILAPSTAEAVELIGVQAEQQAFQIKASALAFKILSSGLYSDQIRAVIRELSTNAYDAQLEAGRGDIPFKVHLPTRFEPWFSVTDKGIGMDHDRVMNNYTTYFGSTKQDTNDLVGCLGLGSKSPFAYTETFTLISTKDGVKRTYTALISEEGFPKILLLSEEPTDDCNGVHVQFPVKVNDTYEFHQKARAVYLDFPVKPEINTIQGGPLGVVEYSVKTDKWGLRKGHYNDMGWSVRVRVIQGCVAYPLDYSQLGFEHPLLSSNVDLFVPIGSVEVTPGRESLSYTKFTNENLKVVLEEVLESLVDTYAKEFDTCNTRIEAILKMNQLRRDAGALFGVVEKRLYKRDFKNFKLVSDRIEVDQALFVNVDLFKPDILDKSASLDNYFAPRPHREACAAGEDWTGYTSQVVDVIIRSKCIVVYDDLGKAGIRALLARMDDHSEFVELHPNGDRNKYQVLVVGPYLEPYAHGVNKAGETIYRRRIHADAWDEAQALAEIFEAEIMLASKYQALYPPPARAKSIRAKSKVRRVMWVQSSGWASTTTLRWTPEGIDAQLEELEGEIKFYIPIQERQAYQEKWFVSNSAFIEFHTTLKELKLIDDATDIFGVPVKELPNVVEGNQEWVPLVDLLKTHLEMNLPKEDLNILSALQGQVSVGVLSKTLEMVQGDSRLKGTWLADLVMPCSDRLSALATANQTWSCEVQRVLKIKAFMDRLNLKPPVMKTDDLHTIQRDLIKEHPLLMDYGRNTLVQYVTQVQEIKDLREALRLKSLETPESE